ncbi:MAG TPA: phage baseplate assembly protein V [Verrucomicrobiae bacterium]|jgi:phage baseplate assembly protein gpV
MSDQPQRFYGKYRGTVLSNVDSQQIGRVQVQVSDVLGAASSSWAMPSMAAAGSQAGMFIVPPVGSQVWVEFEQGDPDYAIWTGGFWGSSADAPAQSSTPPPTGDGQNIVLQTTGQSIVVLSDAPPTATSGGIILQSGGASIIVNQTGIYISNGTATINLVGNTVSINGTALTIVGS